MILANLAITTALTASTTSTVSLYANNGAYQSAVLYANFTYGSGGTTVSAWVQTSFDGGTTWVDVANFSFTTSSAKAIFNLSGNASVLTPVTPTDGSLTANTALAEMIGPIWRVKTTSTGTYAGSTTLAIYIAPRGLFG